MTTYAVNLYRFSDDPAAMVAFYEALGLRTRVSSTGGGWALMEGAAGWIAVHSAATSDTGAAPGETHLVFLTEQADAAASDLQAKGLDARVWDESYGRQAAVRAPLGTDVWVNEHQADLYGYREHASAEPGPAVVTAIWQSGDFARDAAWLAAFGFEPVGKGDPVWWQAHDNGHGRVGLHGRTDLPTGPNGMHVVRVGLETPEPLEDVVDRLVAAGHDARIVTDENATKVHVTDPDGQQLEVHPLS